MTAAERAVVVPQREAWFWTGFSSTRQRASWNCLQSKRMCGRLRDQLQTDVFVF